MLSVCLVQQKPWHKEELWPTQFAHLNPYDPGPEYGAQTNKKDDAGNSV